ncbi:large ribosomal subunit protein eL39-like [Dugong dugon]
MQHRENKYIDKKKQIALSLSRPSWCIPRTSILAKSSHKIFRIKTFLVRKQKQNRPIPQWIRIVTGHKIGYNSKRRHWRKTKLCL